MRRVLLLAFAACSGGGSGGPVADDDPTECPASLVDNDPCSFAGQC